MRLKHITGNRWFIVGMMMAVSFLVFLNVFSRTESIRTIDWIFTGLFHLPFLLVVMYNVWYLIPHFLFKKRLRVYTLLLSFVFSFSYFAYHFSFTWVQDVLFPNYYLVPIHSGWEIMAFCFGYLALSTLLMISKAFFEQKDAELAVAELKEVNTKTELSMLRAQIHPHFLFNSLNTIYAEALTKSDKAPDLILKLSRMLRYVVDHMEDEEVALEDELTYITEYIHLQKARLSYPESVHFSIQGSANGYRIIPLVIITFIENVFVHGDLSDPGQLLTISLSVTDSVLKLDTQNPVVSSSGLSKTEGIGIANARKRLDAYYPNRHTLFVQQTEHEFRLNLTIDLS
ncbi:MAG: histidine kinase [Bacteroidota bacterium]